MKPLDLHFIQRCGEHSWLSPTEIQMLEQQHRAGVDLATLVVKSGFMTEADLYSRFAQYAGVPFLKREELPQALGAAHGLLPAETQVQLNVLPLGHSGGVLQLATGTLAFETVEQLVFKRLSFRTQFSLVSPAILRLHLQSLHTNPEAAFQAEVLRLSKSQGQTASLEPFSNLLLRFAVAERATDIHIAPNGSLLQVYFRIDGVMQPMVALPSWFARYVSFVKVLADMDISEQRMPQDGSFNLSINGVPYTVRVSTIVTTFGERLALRLLCESSETPDVVALGYTQEAADVLQRVAAEPNGLIVVTGPTGSGKSSTLHAMLRMTDLIGRNVLTVEDPVEYALPMSGQTQVNKKAGYDFQRALRHFLRHDPDVILLGEMRDPETAKAAVDAAATGHLVLSTLHVTSTAGVPNRLISMGLNAMSLAENLRCVISQRLVRRLCRHCHQRRPLSETDQRWLGVSSADGGLRVGCPHCRGTGYLGRLPVYEILRVTPAVRQCIQSGGSADDLRLVLEAGDFVSMLGCAAQHVVRAHTDVDEVERVLGGRL